MEYARASGVFAAKTILEARAAGSYSRERLSRYETLLKDSFVLQDFESFREAPRFLENPRFFRHYPEWLGAVFHDLYDVPAGPKKKFFPTLRKHLSFPELWALLGDLNKARKL
jgi:electron transfer flavoprotein-quinone oxidoreductase